MSKLKKELLILFSLFLLCLGTWLYILKNIKNVAEEYENNYTGKVEFIWRWSELPVNIVVDKELKINKQELTTIANHYNILFQHRYYSDIIKFVDEEVENQAYLTLNNIALDKEGRGMFAYVVKEGVKKRPTIYLSKEQYNSWTPRKRMSIIMHEITHILGLPHINIEGILMKENHSEPSIIALSDFEKELLFLLYSKKMGKEIISPK